MATLSERLALIIDFNGTSAVKGLEGLAKQTERAEDKWDKASASLSKMGAAGLAASGVAATGLVKLAGKASDLNEVTSKTNVIFGDAADSVIAFAKDAGKALGQSETAALEAATGVAQMGKAAGFAGQDLADFSTDLVTLASDLASFNNTSPEEAIQALGAALRGESEPIRAYGVLLDDATLKQRALSMGLIETTTGTLPPAIKVQAAYAEILAQTTDAQGDFARTSDGVANQQRILKAEIDNLATGIGTGLLPAFSAVVSGAADAVGALNNMSDESKTMLGTLAAGGTGVVAALSGVSLVTGQLMKLRDRFTEVGEAGRSLTTAGKVASTAAVGVGVFSAAVALMQANAAKAERAVDDLQAKMADTGETAEVAASRLLLEWVYSNEEARKAMEKAKLSTEDLQRAIYGSDQEFNRAKDTLRELGVENRSLATAAFELTGQIEKQRNAYKGNATEVKAAEAAERALRAESDKTNETKGESARLNAVLGKTTAALVEDTDELSEADKELAERQKAVEESAKKAADALDERRRATEEAYEAALASVDPLLRERAAQRDLAAAAADVTAKTKEAADAKFKDAAKNNEVVSAQDGLIEKLTDVAGAYVEAKGKALDSREGAELYVAKLRELRDQYGVNLGPAISIYDELIRRIDETIRKQSSVAGVGSADRPYNPGGGVRVNSFGSDLPGGGFSPTVPGFGGSGSGTVNLTVNLVPQGGVVVSQQGAQWVADALAVLIRTNGVGALPFAGVTAKV